MIMGMGTGTRLCLVLLTVALCGSVMFAAVAQAASVRQVLWIHGKLPDGAAAVNLKLTQLRLVTRFFDPGKNDEVEWVTERPEIAFDGAGNINLVVWRSVSVQAAQAYLSHRTVELSYLTEGTRVWLDSSSPSDPMARMLVYAPTRSPEGASIVDHALAVFAQVKPVPHV